MKRKGNLKPMTLAMLRHGCKNNLASQIAMQTPYCVYAGYGSTPRAAKKAYTKALYDAITTDELATVATLLFSNLILSSGESPSLSCTCSYRSSDYSMSIYVSRKNTTYTMLGYIGVVFCKCTNGQVYCLHKAASGNTVAILITLPHGLNLGTPEVMATYAIPLINTGATAAAAYAALNFNDGESIRTNIPILVAEGAYGTSVLATSDDSGGGGGDE